MKMYEHFSAVGIPTIRSDGEPKVTGATRYTADHTLPGMDLGPVSTKPFFECANPADRSRRSKENKRSRCYIDCCESSASINRDRAQRYASARNGSSSICWRKSGGGWRGIARHCGGCAKSYRG